jgi:glycosyltransferase involved in cell wall biosynthesis
MTDCLVDIRVGITEAHGAADEAAHTPPPGVRYTDISRFGRPAWRLVRSPIKGYLQRFSVPDCDVIEAVLSPVVTENLWIYSCANLQEATAFSIGGLPVPRVARVSYVSGLLAKPNARKMILWSEAGKRTLTTYGNITDQRVLDKVTVVYPAIRHVPDELIRFGTRAVNILFSGDFFRKGGAHVVDAFERAQAQYPDLTLRVCCDERIDFNTRDETLRRNYLDRIRSNRAITFGRVSRAEMVDSILPTTDIYMLPTYNETFGFALLEAMAFGIPIVATNHFAIPEIVEDNVAGLLVDTSGYDCEQMFRGYRVDAIPADFHEYMTEAVYAHLIALIHSPGLRHRLGQGGVRAARTKFSIAARNAKMLDIYREAIRE